MEGRALGQSSIAATKERSRLADIGNKIDQAQAQSHGILNRLDGIIARLAQEPQGMDSSGTEPERPGGLRALEESIGGVLGTNEMISERLNKLESLIGL